MALVAVGDGEVAISGVCPHVWDCAAGQALLIGVGANLYDARGRVITYTRTGEMQCEGGIFGGIGASGVACDGGLQKSSCAHRDLHRRAVSSGPCGERWLLTRARLPGLKAACSGRLREIRSDLLVEFQTPEEIARKYPRGVRRLEDGGAWRTLAGQPTDDSETALALARMLIDRGRYDEEAAARAYVDWFRSRPFDIGSTTRSALQGASDAMHGRRPAVEGARRGANPSSQSNGALMRVCPIGILGVGAARADDVFTWASTDAGLTHPHRVCRESTRSLRHRSRTQIRSSCLGDRGARACARVRGANRRI